MLLLSVRTVKHILPPDCFHNNRALYCCFAQRIISCNCTVMFAINETPFVLIKTQIAPWHIYIYFKISKNATLIPIDQQRFLYCSVLFFAATESSHKTGRTYGLHGTLFYLNTTPGGFNEIDCSCDLAAHSSLNVQHDLLHVPAIFSTKILALCAFYANSQSMLITFQGIST